MDLPAGLAADLARLTTALDEPGTDLADLLGALQEAFLVAVPSGLGLSVTIRVDADEVTVCTLDGAAAGGAPSLRVPLGSWTDAEPGSAVIFYAATAGALVDLAADLGFRLGLRDDVVLDGDPRPGEAHRVTSGLHELAVVQRALGVLIARGRTPLAARRELEQHARASDTTVGAVAAELIRGEQPADRTGPPSDKSTDPDR